MIYLLLILASLASLAAAAFCAGTETGFLSVSRERILHLSREGGRKAQIVQHALGDMQRTTTTLLVGNNLASVGYSTATAALIANGCADSFWRSIWSFVAAFIVLYFAEFLPKLLCAARPLRRSLRLAPTYAFLSVVLRPLINPAMWVTNLLLDHGRKDLKYVLTAEDLVRILQDRKDGVCLSDFESALITRLLVLRMKKKAITAEGILSALKDFES